MQVEQHPGLLDTRAVARALGVPQHHARRLVAGRIIPALKVGRQWRVRPADLEKWITDRVTQP